MRKPFKLWHSVLGLAVLVCIEDLLLRGSSQPGIILLCALGGGAWVVLLAVEVVSEIKAAVHMLVLLSAVMLEFVLFFAFQYAFLEAALPGSFAGLPATPVSFVLHSTMVFVFNPLYVPGNEWGRALLLVNTLGALVLVLFIAQNIWQFRLRDKNAL